MAGPYMKQIPLRNRYGEVIAHALVDDEDYERVMVRGRWHLTGKGYVQNAVTGPRGKVFVLLHRFLLGLKPGDPEVDHEDRNPLNNQKTNLRRSTAVLNGHNRDPRGNSNNTSGHRGVTWDRQHNKWRATVSINRRRHHIGRFDELADAVAAIEAWRNQHP
jgi:hypothetical protein